MTTLYNWGDTTREGVWLDDVARTDMYMLRDTIERLRSVNTYLIVYDSNQLIIADLDYMDADRYRARIQKNETEIYDLKKRITITEIDIMRLFDEQEDFKIKFPENGNNNEEVTEDFFIMIDMLPEHIRKELKIYIKNDNIIQKR